MSEHYFEDDLEERDDVVGGAPAGDDDKEGSDDGEPWAKTSSGSVDEITTDE